MPFTLSLAFSIFNKQSIGKGRRKDYARLDDENKMAALRRRMKLIFTESRGLKLLAQAVL